MHIGNVDLSEHVLVVAEIGNNHEGDIEVAERLVRAASDCGVDAVKFQTFQTARFANPADRVRYDRLQSFELAPSAFERLAGLAKSLGLLFLSTPLDLESVTVLEPLVDAFKIASGDNDFYPLLERVCSTNTPILLSTGASDLAHIRHVKQFIEEQWHDRGFSQRLAVLHCVSCYPTPPDQANLAAIPLLARELQCVTGYSDHTVGLEAALLAVALGAHVVEKHFTLDKHFSDFRDHQLSADPSDMRRLVEDVARVRAFVGRGDKVIQPCEKAMVEPIRRSIVAASALPAGHRIESNDLMWLRPATGLRPGQESQVIGRTLKRSVVQGEALLPSLFQVEDAASID